MDVKDQHQKRPGGQAHADQSSGEPLIDPRLEEMLALLREAPPRDPQAQANGRARFLAELDELMGTQPIPEKQPPVRSQFVLLNALAGKIAALGLSRRPAFNVLAIVLVVLIFLFGGAGMTAYASRGALPGDRLYQVKTSLEHTQVELTGDPARQARLHLRFAQRRLDEIAALIDEGRFNDIDQATLQFQTHIQMTLQAVNVLAKVDPARAASLNAEVSQTLIKFSQTLGRMVDEVPVPVKIEVQDAKDAADQAEGGEIEPDDGKPSNPGPTEDDQNKDGSQSPVGDPTSTPTPGIDNPADTDPGIQNPGDGEPVDGGVDKEGSGAGKDHGDAYQNPDDSESGTKKGDHPDYNESGSHTGSLNRSDPHLQEDFPYPDQSTLNPDRAHPLDGGGRSAKQSRHTRTTQSLEIRTR